MLILMKTFLGKTVSPPSGGDIKASRMNTATDYVKHGLVLVPIPRGHKGPQHAGWQQAENCIATVEAAEKLNGSNIGLAHLYSHTCAIDIDDFDRAVAWFEQQGIDLAGLLMRTDSVQISSGREGRAKLLYRLPDGINSLPTYQHRVDGETVFELRCSTRKGTTVMDVLPPSIHPVTGKAYTWKGDWTQLPTLPDAVLAAWPQHAHEAKPPKPLENRDEVEEALTFVNPNAYPTWVMIGMALHSTGSDDAFEIWDIWSQQGDTYHTGECRAKWASFTGAGGITLSTLFHEARKGGFEGYLKTMDDRDDTLILTPIRVADWQGKPIPARQWSWDSWLPKGTVAGLGGAPGVAKSLFAQQLCTHKALGGQFLGSDIPAGAALYITCEDELDELMRRQARINTALRRKMSDMHNLHLDSWMGENAQLVIIDKGVFRRTPRFAALDELISELKAEIVALDLLADMWNGNECDRQAVNGYVKSQLAYLAHRHNTCILGLYHPSLSGMASGAGTSGSTAWEGSFRSRLYLKNDEESGTRILTRPKSNYATTDDEHRLMWQDGYLVPESAMAKSAINERLEKWCAAFMECLQAGEKNHKEASPSYNSPNYFGKVFPDTWLMLDGRHKTITRKQFEKAFMKLEFDGAIEVLPKSKDVGKRIKFIGYK